MKRELVPIVTIREAMECAALMASSDTGVTIKRSFEECLKLFLDRSRDIYIMKDNARVMAFCVVERDTFSQPSIRMVYVDSGYREQGIEGSITKWVGGNLLTQKEDNGAYATGDRNKMDIDFIFNNLRHLYWATNLTRENLIGRIMNSMCFGVFVNDQQKGFARVVTDYFSFAYLADVFIEEKERGKGYSKILMEYVLDYPSLRDIKWLLATRDMHRLYEKFGFYGVNNPERFMGKNGWRSF